MKVLLSGVALFYALQRCCAIPAEDQNANGMTPETLTNGSFETGTGAPTGWKLNQGASWIAGEAHGGTRLLNGIAKKEELICESEEIVLKPATDYRLDGWVNCKSGTACLGVDFLDNQARVISRNETLVARPSGGWRFVAVEVNSAPESGKSRPVRARVWFRVKGRADLDDVGFSVVATSFMGNKGMEADDRGRIGYWGEEKDDTLLPGRRGGEFRPDKEIKRDGKSSAVLIPAADWTAIASINYGVAPWTERYEFSVWARSEAPATAQILVCWTDDDQRVVRVDPGPAVRSEEWQRMSLSLTAPAAATGVRLIATARGGRVWFDDSDLLRLHPSEPRVRVFVNQVGYDLDGPKCAVIAANFFPRGGGASFQLVTPGGKSVFKQAARCSGRVLDGTQDDWGWYFWRANFSSCKAPGQFRVRAELLSSRRREEAESSGRGPTERATSAWAGKVRGESAPFAIGRGEVLQETAQSAVDFFFIQRCGFDVPGWHKACHLDDAKLPDGTHIDAVGGWHSAGDYNKLMYEHGDGGVDFALLKALDSGPEYFGHFDRNGDGIPDALDEAIWGAEFVAKMQLPETGGLRNTVSQGPGRSWTKWSTPETHTDNVVGTADDPVIQPGEGNSPLVIGGWAQLGSMLERRGRKNNYLADALRLWGHATGGGTNLGSAYLLLSALDLHAVTRQPAYLEYAQRAAQSLLAQQTTTGRLQGAFGNYGEGTAAALASFALAYKDDPLNPRIRQALRKYITFCVRQANNPFGFSQQPVGETTQFFPPDMGNNFQVLQRAWAAALVYRLIREPAALVFAVDQMDWVLGKNPLNLCLFEGKGAFNPPRYHHRYNQIPGRERGAVPGTVPNGFVRELGMADRPGMDMSRGGNRAPSFRTSEPWLVHNLFYLLAASEIELAIREADRK